MEAHALYELLEKYRQGSCSPEELERLEAWYTSLGKDRPDSLLEEGSDTAKLLAANVVCLSDGGGEVFAARVPVVGRSKVSLFLSNLLNATSAFTSRTRAVELNGLFAMATERDNAPPGFAKKVATLFQINDEGRINGIYFVMASRKLAAVPAASEVENEFSGY